MQAPRASLKRIQYKSLHHWYWRMCSVSAFPEHEDSTKRDYKLVSGLQQKMGNYQETVIGKISFVLKIILSITAMCCVVLGKTFKRKKISQIINSKNNHALILVIRKITNHNMVNYHQRTLILEKYADCKGRLLMICRNCIIILHNWSFEILF